MVKNLHANVGGRKRLPTLGREGLLEEDIATHSSILAWRIPLDRGAWRALVRGVAKS